MIHEIEKKVKEVFEIMRKDNMLSISSSYEVCDGKDIKFFFRIVKTKGIKK